MNENNIGFRIPYFVMFKYMLLNMAIISVPLALIVPLFLQSGFRFFMILAIAIMTVIAAALAAVLTTYKPRAYLSPQGITVHDSRGKLEFTRWDEISNPKYQNRLGIKYMFFNKSGLKYKLVLPLFLADIENLRTLVIRFAGADNPLAASLIEYLD